MVSTVCCRLAFRLTSGLVSSQVSMRNPIIGLKSVLEQSGESAFVLEKAFHARAN